MRREVCRQLAVVLGVGLLSVGCTTSQAASRRHNAPGSMDQAVLLLQDRVARLESQLDTLIEEQEYTRQAMMQEMQQVSRAQEQMTDAVSSQAKRSSSESSIKKTARNIQLALKKAGYYQGSVDGKLGPHSRRAIKEFQQANQLEVDGKVGKQTWSALRRYL